MLLLHQAGGVKVGEVVRYTLTYTPSHDRILPSPTHLHLKVKNTSAIPLRAAYLHGPYTLHVGAYPSTFNPNHNHDDSRYGPPDFVPNLKAGGSWSSKLTVPENIREGGNKANVKLNADGSPKSATWIVEIASQIVFSNNASVNFELLIARDERSLDLGFAAVASKGHGEPGKLHDFRVNQDCASGPTHDHAQNGVYSRAIYLVVEDVIALWNKPPLPRWEGQEQPEQPTGVEPGENVKPVKGQKVPPTSDVSGLSRKQKQKKLHLVILSHGLHSNTGADLLYLKESIDATAKTAREAARKRREDLRQKARSSRPKPRSSSEGGVGAGENNEQLASTAPLSGGQDELSDHEYDENENDDDDDEQIIVRGFPGNVVRTERGIQYLGKRLAKFILTTTYPDQPFLPASKSISRNFSLTIGGSNKSQNQGKQGPPAHRGSSIHKATKLGEKLPYTFTKISFIGHSLGGLVQTYAIAYIYKHSPQFFENIKPESFIAMATPFLGLSNENPLYVKFALDFGLVGRTGRDLGLTWRAPTIARSGWSAMVAGLGSGGEKEAKHDDPRFKPMLRILPTGPAHKVLKKFRNRTLYSNVVNDGIVPLRTSCLLFLDWRGLDRVENARRDNGLITTMAQFGWAELTGSNTAATSHRPSTASQEGWGSPEPRRSSDAVPSTRESTAPQEVEGTVPEEHQFLKKPLDADPTTVVAADSEVDLNSTKTPTDSGTSFADIWKFFRPNSPSPERSRSPKLSNSRRKTYRRAQTIRIHADDGTEIEETLSPQDQGRSRSRPRIGRGDSVNEPPPQTSFLEAAGDILNPPLPSTAWIVDPSTRTRTIFHDRIYHPEDIPDPPPRRRIGRSMSNDGRRTSTGSTGSSGSMDPGGIKIEEKIARAYHKELSWRKVLVRLEPDAHNNMIVRRMFANAYGWDVIKHLCDTHFADTYDAKTRDDEESGEDRVEDIHQRSGKDGEQVRGQISKKRRGKGELNEADDEIQDLGSFKDGAASFASQRSPLRLTREDSVTWDDALLDEGGDDTEDEGEGPFASFQRFWSPKGQRRHSDQQLTVDTSIAMSPHDARLSFAGFLNNSPGPVDGHRGLGVVDRKDSRSKSAADTDAIDPESIDPLLAEAAHPSMLPVRPPSIHLGLGKTVEEQIGSPESADKSSNGRKSVAERVAQASMPEPQ